MKKIISSIFIFCFSAAIYAQNGVPGNSSKKYIGKTIWVCDTIHEAVLDNISTDGPTVLYVGKSFEERTFSLVFTQAVLQNFSYEPTSKMINHAFCAHGKVVLYKSKPAMYIKLQSQIKIPQ